MHQPRTPVKVTVRASCVNGVLTALGSSPRRAERGAAQSRAGPGGGSACAGALHEIVPL